MDNDEIIDGFADLFEGNPLYIGTEAGGCEPMWFDMDIMVEDHLYGHQPIGVYPIWQNQVKWGCIDLDEGDEPSLIHARNIDLLLREFEIVGHLERSRSKGFHVWVFADCWGSAATMRDALLAACDLVDAPTKEINPKQATLAEGQVGNYVRLPYPGGLAPGWLKQDRQVMFDPELGPIPVSTWIEVAVEMRASWDHLAELAQLHKSYVADAEQVYTPTVHGVPSDRYAGDSRSRMKPFTRWIYLMGPREEMDRSSALWKLACMLAEDGRHTLEEALELLTEADASWGKFLPRADGELRLNELMRKAWAARANAYGG